MTLLLNALDVYFAYFRRIKSSRTLPPKVIEEVVNVISNISATYKNIRTEEIKHCTQYSMEPYI